MSPGAIPSNELRPSTPGARPRMAVGLFGGSSSPGYRRLFDSLAQLFPVEFYDGGKQNDRELHAAIVFSKGLAEGMAAVPEGVPTYLAMQDWADPSPASGGSIEIRFGTGVGVVHCLRGQTMEDRDLQLVFQLAPAAGDEVLALGAGQPVWIRRPRKSGAIDLVAALPPAIDAGDYLCLHLVAGRFMRLLPLLIFLQRLTAPLAWQGPRQKACFVFDDPSLYGTSYGFLDFRQLAQHSLTHNYAVALAIIPLDTWRPSAATMDIFRAHSPRLSLLLHGNDHLKHELAEAEDRADSVGILAQALRRFQRLERQPGLEVCRVMEAPHGAWSEAALRGARQLEFEGVLATPELLLRYNPRAIWPSTLGLELTNLLVGGLPTLPRIIMTKEWKTSVLLAAALEQPILLAGHHTDAVDNLALMAEFARLVNGFQAVDWMSPREILRSSFKQLRLGESLHVQMFSRLIHVTVAENVREICIHRPWIAEGDADEILTVQSSGKPIWSSNEAGAVAGPVSIRSPAAIEIQSRLKNPIDYRTAPGPSWRLWPMVRKALSELRDRTGPFRARKGGPGPVARMAHDFSPF